MTGLWAVLITTFLASAVEAIEMVTIVVGVGATRGWRSTIIGVASGFGVLAVIVVILGAALSVVPVGPLRLVIGALLLVFGLQWFRKGIMRVAARGLAGIGGSDPHGDAELWRGPGMDWTAWFLAFKGVVLEGLEVAIIVVSFGAGANQLGGAVVGGAGGIVNAPSLLLDRRGRAIPVSLHRGRRLDDGGSGLYRPGPERDPQREPPGGMVAYPGHRRGNARHQSPARERHATMSVIAVVGLATMGMNLASNLARNGFGVSVYNRTTSRVDDFMKQYGSEGAFTPAHTPQ